MNGRKVGRPRIECNGDCDNCIHDDCIITSEKASKMYIAEEKACKARYGRGIAELMHRHKELRQTEARIYKLCLPQHNEVIL